MECSGKKGKANVVLESVDVTSATLHSICTSLTPSVLGQWTLDRWLARAYAWALPRPVQAMRPAEQPVWDI